MNGETPWWRRELRVPAWQVFVVTMLLVLTVAAAVVAALLNAI